MESPFRVQLIPTKAKYVPASHTYTSHTHIRSPQGWIPLPHHFPALSHETLAPKVINGHLSPPRNGRAHPIMLRKPFSPPSSRVNGFFRPDLNRSPRDTVSSPSDRTTDTVQVKIYFARVYVLYEKSEERKKKKSRVRAGIKCT